MSDFVQAISIRADFIKSELAEECLRSFGRLRIQATGWSMMPTLWPGDILEIEQVNAECVAEGEIVLFRRNHRLCAHRVISKNFAERCDCRMTTQGDSLPAPDPPISSSQLLGKISLISRGGHIFQPRRTLSSLERGLVTILRRSFHVSRLLARLHSLTRTQQKEAACQH